jgi:hypothetical protein
MTTSPRRRFRPSRWPTLRRLADPTALGLVVVCLLFPFLNVSCSTEVPRGVPEQEHQQWRVTYSGLDILVGGQPEVAVADRSTDGELRTRRGPDLIDLIGQEPSALRPQPLAWLAVTLIVAAAVLAAAGGTPRRAAIVAGLTLTAALALYAATLLAREQATDTVAQVLRSATNTSAGPISTPIREWEHRPWVRDQFQFRYGFWIAIGTLVAAGLASVVRAVPTRSRPRPITDR